MAYRSPKSWPDLRRRALAALLAGGLPFGTLAAAPEPSTERPTIPYRPAEAAGGGALALRIALGFVVVIGVGIGGLYLLRRYAPGLGGLHAAPGQRIQVVEIRRLTPRTTLFLVQVEGERLLLAQSGDRIARLWQKGAVDASATPPL